MKVRALLVAAVAVAGLAIGASPVAQANPCNPLPQDPMALYECAMSVNGRSVVGADNRPSAISGDRIDYSVTATSNGIPSSRFTIVSYMNDNRITPKGMEGPVTLPMYRTVYFKPGSGKVAFLKVMAASDHPAWGPVTYTCTIKKNGAVISSNTGVGSVNC